MERTTMAKADIVYAQREFINRVYGWMFAGLLLTAVVAKYVLSSGEILAAVAGNMMVLILAELGLVMGISWGINRIGAMTATLLFMLYSAMNGLTFAVILLMYTSSSVASTFFITASTFGVLAVYGHVTKTDLTSVGNICFMALIGLIIATVVNIFLRSAAIHWITSLVGVLVFVGLTAYDAQKIKNMGVATAGMGDEATQKYAIIGALALYLDFINLFLMLLNLFGRRR